jgi:hypothetical protein
VYTPEYLNKVNAIFVLSRRALMFKLRSCAAMCVPAWLCCVRFGTRAHCVRVTHCGCCRHSLRQFPKAAQRKAVLTTNGLDPALLFDGPNEPLSLMCARARTHGANQPTAGCAALCLPS